MTKTRTFALLVGVLATIAGLAIIAGVSLGLQLTDLFLGLVAVLAALQGLRYVQRRRDIPYKTITTDDPEMRVSVPVPGADFDDEVVAATTRRKRWTARSRIVDRLESRARQALVLRGGRTPAEAEALLESGAWTDDVVAARFLGAEASLPLRRRLRLLLSGQSMLVKRVDRTVAAIETIGNESARMAGDETGSVAADETGSVAADETGAVAADETGPVVADETGPVVADETEGEHP